MQGTSNEIEHLHKVSKYDFLDSEGLGVSLEPLKRVVGFVEHSFHYSPIQALDDPEMWSIERLELVSLHRFDQPRAYVLDHFPRMDQLANEDIPTRELDDFESKSLRQLKTEVDVVISNSNNEYRMLGSLRAAKQCLSCHSVDRGELLGAFSYQIRKHPIVLPLESGESRGEKNR